MPLEDFRDLYWLKEELVSFARRLGLRTSGSKPELTLRIEERLGGQSPSGAAEGSPATARPSQSAARDSDQQLSRSTPVVNYKSDAETRAFFQQQIGPAFHFTYHLNQFRLARTRAGEPLTYGDLIDEWLAERDRRSAPDYKAPIASHGKYNRFIRDYFADPKNRGRSLQDAAVAWNQVKKGRGTHSYDPEGR